MGRKKVSRDADDPGLLNGRWCHSQRQGALEGRGEGRVGGLFLEMLELVSFKFDCMSLVHKGEVWAGD